MSDELTVVDGGALTAQLRGEIDIQIATALKYPRNVAKQEQAMVAMATSSQDVAASCFYKMRRGDKDIEGPSVRTAEIAAMYWKNLRVAGRVIEIGETSVVAQAVVIDLETNVAHSAEVRRSIMTSPKHGRPQRYSEDMINVTANAAVAIATRNAIFKIIPKAIVNNVYKTAMRVAIGKVDQITIRLPKALERYEREIGISEARVMARLGKPKDKVTLQDLELLVGLFNAITDGDTSAEEEFPEVQKPEPEAPANPVPESKPETRPEEAPKTDTPKVEPPKGKGPVTLRQKYNGLAARAEQVFGVAYIKELNKAHENALKKPLKDWEDEQFESIISDLEGVLARGK